jgi:hypothetical protein
MIKHLVYLVSIAAAMLTSSLNNSRTNILHTLPASVNADSEFIVEAKITKVGISGFAKYQVVLPNDFVAVPIDVIGARFKQDENILKITWMTLPEADEFIIKYRVLVLPEAKPGDYDFLARFVYIENNEKRSISSDKMLLTVEPMAQTAKKAPEPTPKNQGEQSASAQTIELSDNGVGCVLLYKRLNENEFNLTVKVIKSSVTGFAKIEVPLCEGLSAVNLKNEDKGVFSFNDNKVKYVWTDLPAKNDISVSFKVIRNKDAAWLSACNIEGEFAYLFNDQSNKCKLKDINLNFVDDITYSKLTVASQEVDVDEVVIQAVNVPINQEQTIPAQQPTPEVQTQEPQTNMENTRQSEPVVIAEPEPKRVAEPNPVSQAIEEPVNYPVQNVRTEAVKVSEPQPVNAQTEARKAAVRTPDSSPAYAESTGIVYRVQVCATRNEATTEKVKRIYSVPDDIRLEMHEGWFKFTVGQFSQYRQARDKREEMAPYNLPGPFVTAYNNGLRITVQEALMISKQNWVQ